MKEITVKALGKINIGLDVTGIREDGYHLVRMIMQTVDLYDTVEIKETADSSVTMTCNKEDVPLDESNLCVKAARLMMERYHLTGGYHINLTKRIPVAAGMAGGSSDAAAVIRGINALEGLKISDEELMELSLPIGADVPYCIVGGTMLAEGIGEELTELTDLSGIHVLIAKPPIAVSTKEVYQALDSTDGIIHPNIDALMAAVEKKDVDSICENMGNVLEDVTIPLHSEVARLKMLMEEGGALKSMMSGSGPTVFGIFDDPSRMEDCLKTVRNSGLTEMAIATTMCKY